MQKGNACSSDAPFVRGREAERFVIQSNTPTKPRVLVLDEDRIILQSLSQFLRREGYDVRTTDRPEEALSLMEAGQVELLLADINIPGLKPAEFLRDIKRRFGHVVV